jgi:hypothetical protein
MTRDEKVEALRLLRLEGLAGGESPEERDDRYRQWYPRLCGVSVKELIADEVAREIRTWGWDLKDLEEVEREINNRDA